MQSEQNRQSTSKESITLSTVHAEFESKSQKWIDEKIDTEDWKIFTLLHLTGIQPSILKLFYLMKDQLNAENPTWNKHKEMVDLTKSVINKFCEQRKRFLLKQKQQICERILDYILKLILVCDHEETIESAWNVLSEFKFGKFILSLANHGSSLIHLIESMKTKLTTEQHEWDKHRKMCLVMKEVLKKYKNSLTEEIRNSMLEYLIELIERCDGETINSVLDVWRVFPFQRSHLSFDKFHSTLQTLIDYIENQLNTELSEWSTHVKLCEIMKITLKKFKKLLTQQTCTRMFQYLKKLFDQCEDCKTISSACNALRQFPFNKYQSLLLELIDCIEKQFNSEHCDWDKYGEFCRIIEMVLRNYNTSLSGQTYERMTNYLMKLIETCDNVKTIKIACGAFAQLSLDKCQTSLLTLIDLVEKKANDEQNRWDRDEKLCRVMIEVLKNYELKLSNQTCERIFKYLMKLIEKCDHNKTIESAWDVLTQFPFDKYQSSLLALVDFVENKESEDQNQWDRYEKLCRVMKVILEICKQLFSIQTCERIFNYLMKLIEKCDHNETVESAWDVLTQFQFDKYQSSLLELIDFVENKKNEEPDRWDADKKLCRVMKEVVKKYKDTLSNQTCERIFNYLMKLIEKCNHSETIESARDVLTQFPFDKYQSSLIKLIDSPEKEILTEQQRYDKHWNICNIIYDALKISDNFFDNETAEKMFNFFLKLTEQYEDSKMITQVFVTLSYFSTNESLFKYIKFHKCESLFSKLIELTETKVQINYDQHRHMWNSIERILKFHLNWLPSQEMFNYIVKIIEICEPEIFDCAWIALTRFLLYKYSLDKSESLLLHLINSIETHFHSEEAKWIRHGNLCVVIKMVMANHFSFMSRQTCDRIFEFIMKLLDKCDNEETIYSACNALANFPFNKFSFQFEKYESSLHKLIISREKQFNISLPVYNNHFVLCSVICGTLINRKNSLSQEIYNKIFDYIMKLIEHYNDAEIINQVYSILYWFPFAKYQFQFENYESSLLKLIDLDLENELISKQTAYLKKWNLCDVLQWALRNCPSTLSHKIYEKIFNFISKLIDLFDDSEIINEAFNVLAWFPFCQYQSSLLQLIDGIAEFFLKTEQNSWDIHRGLCEVIGWQLEKHKDSLSQETCEEIFNYLSLIFRCEDEEVNDSALDAFMKYPFNKHQSSLIKLIDTMETQMITEKNDFDQNKICEIIKELFKEYKDILNQQTRDRIYSYLKKNNAFGNDDFSEVETTLHDESLSKLTAFMTGQLNAKQSTYAAQELTHLQGGQIKFKFSTIYKILMKDLQSNGLQPNHNMHTYWCSALNQFLKNSQQNSFSQCNKNQLIDYLLHLFYHCKDTQTILSAILLAEQVALKEKYKNFRVNLLKDKILGILFYNDNPFFRGFPDEFDFTRYQVDWCARWCVDNLMERGKQMKKFPLIKLSSDRFGARNDNKLNEKSLDNEDNIKCHPVCSQFPTANGVYFYEIIIVTTGEMLFGWSTRETELNNNEADEHSILSSKKCIRHKKKQWNMPNRADYQAGDVMGCLIDFDRQQFIFYYNGKAIECVSEKDDFDINDGKDHEYVKDNVIKGITFSSSPYYATAFLFHRQQCYFNFGQLPFKFAPKDITFRHFHEESCGDERKYQLSETCSIGDCYDLFYWFKHSPVDNKIYLFYADNKQLEYDEFVKAVEEDIRNNRHIRKWENKSKETEEKKCSFLRFNQSIIDEMGEVIFGLKVDVMAQWIGTVFDRWIDRATEAKLLELLYPYLQLHIELFERTENIHRHRNICIVLYYLIKFSKTFHQNFIIHIGREIFSYLTRILVETNDEWTQMFALISLESLDISASEKKMLQNNKKISEFLNKWKDYSGDNNSTDRDILNNPYPNFNSPSFYQLKFLCERFFNQLLISPTEPEPNPAALTTNDRTSNLKLSLDLLSARSDWGWQCVRSQYQVNEGIYYFEAILLTNGPMKIGWSIKQKDLVQGKDGDENEFAIGFDGFNQCVWQNCTKLQLKHSLTKWKARDVVGCLIETSKKLFSFYLNGHPIGYNALPINFSSQPYLAFISLSSHQQVYLNFGQSTFKYPPKNDYLDFCHSNQNQSLSMDLSIISKNNFYITTQSNINGNKLIRKRKISDDSNIDDDEPSFLTCRVCQANISTKRLKLDCCEHFQYNTGHIPSRSNKNIKTDDYSIVKCQVCDHLKICSECCLNDCAQCREIPSASSCELNNDQINEQSLNFQNKNEIKNLKPLEFLNNCDHGKMCKHRLKSILDCPKYNEIHLSPKSLSTQLINIQTNDKIDKLLQITPIKSPENEIEMIALNTNNNQQQNNSKIIEFEWEIEKFSSYFYRKNTDSEIKSNIFSANENSQNKYYLCLWPNGCDENAKDFVSIKLYLHSSSEAMIEVNCRISILDWDGDSYYHDEGRGWLSPIQSNLPTTSKQFNPPANSANISFPNYIAYDRILDPKNGLLPEDTLTIQCKIEEKQFKEEL